MHFGDLFSEFPRRTVLKVSEASLQFMPAVDVKDHQADATRSRRWPQEAGRLFTFGFTEAFKRLISAFMSGRPSKPLLMPLVDFSFRPEPVSQIMTVFVAALVPQLEASLAERA